MMDYATALHNLRTKLARIPDHHPVPLTHQEAVALAAGPTPEIVMTKVFTRGDAVIIYQGMGEFQRGVVTAFDGDTGNVTVLADGYIDLKNIRHEPYEVEYPVGSVNPDPDPTASRAEDQRRMIPGYKLIEAKL